MRGGAVKEQNMKQLYNSKIQEQDPIRKWAKDCKRHPEKKIYKWIIKHSKDVWPETIGNANENTGIIHVPGPRQSRIRKADITRCWRKGREKGNPGVLMGNVKLPFHIYSCCRLQEWPLREANTCFLETHLSPLVLLGVTLGSHFYINRRQIVGVGKKKLGHLSVLNPTCSCQTWAVP